MFQLPTARSQFRIHEEVDSLTESDLTFGWLTIVVDGLGRLLSPFDGDTTCGAENIDWKVFSSSSVSCSSVGNSPAFMA